MEQSKGKVNLTEEELRKELRITKKSDNWSQRLANGHMPQKNLKIINLRAKNPHLLRFKIQTLWNHFWKVLSEFWQTWGNTCTKYLHRVFLHKNVALLLAENFCEFSTLYSIFSFWIWYLGILVYIWALVNQQHLVKRWMFRCKMSNFEQMWQIWQKMKYQTESWGICPDWLNWPQFCPTSALISNFSAAFFTRRCHVRLVLLHFNNWGGVHCRFGSAERRLGNPPPGDREISQVPGIFSPMPERDIARGPSHKGNLGIVSVLMMGDWAIGQRPRENIKFFEVFPDDERMILSVFLRRPGHIILLGCLSNGKFPKIWYVEN